MGPRHPDKMLNYASKLRITGSPDKAAASLLTAISSSPIKSFLTAIIPIPRPTERICRRFPHNGGIVRPVRSADCELHHARVLVTHDGRGDCQPERRATTTGKWDYCKWEWPPMR